MAAAAIVLAQINNRTVIITNDQRGLSVLLIPVDGTCSGIPAGRVKIDVHIANCQISNQTTDGETGWESSRRLMVMEVHPHSGILKLLTPTVIIS